MNDLKFDTVEVAEASKWEDEIIAPLTAYTFLGGEFGHKVEVVSELGQNDWQTKEVLQEIARRWNNYDALMGALKEATDALHDIINAADNDQPYSASTLAEQFADIVGEGRDLLDTLKA
jgi:hypothetical protein